MMKTYIYLFYILFSITLNAKPILINSDYSQVSILEHATFFIDSSSKLTLKDVKKKEFKKTNTDYLRLGYTDDTLWIKFSIKNSSKKELERYITLTNPMLDTIELYTKNDLNYNKETQGILHPSLSDKDNILHHSFKVNFTEYEIKEFYYKTHSISSANYFKLFIKDINKLYKDEFSYQLIETLFFGAMLAFIFYNLFIFIFTRDVSYFYYILFMIIIVLNHLSYTRLIVYFVPKEYVDIEAFFAIYYIGLSNLFFILFIKSILDLHKYKKINFILRLLIITNIIIMIYSTINQYLLDYMAIHIFISMFFFVYTCVYLVIRKHSQAKYLFLGWSINLLGIGMLLSYNLGAWSIINTLPYFYESCTFLEALLFSIALASKLNKTKELEQSVKTNEVLTRELHHRVKNNMQFIILMYRLKLTNLTTPQIDQKLSEIEGSIQAMSKTHEILYNQENLSDIDTKLYFENLIEEMKRSFDTSKIKISLEISTTMDTQTSIYCGIILNELMTNSFKYAFENKQGRIDISLEKSKNKYIFIIKDSGIGFDYDKKKDESFGLSFVHEMVRNELKGKLEVKSKKGTNIRIKF